MGKPPNKKIRQREKAEKMRKCIISRGLHKRTCEGFAKSNLTQPSQSMRERVAVERYTYYYNNSSNNYINCKYYTTNVSVRSHIINYSGPILDAERKKWMIYVDFQKLLWCEKFSRREAQMQICAREGISLSTLLRIVKKVDNRECLARRPGSGNVAKYHNTDDINCFMKEKGSQCQYIFSIIEMAEWVKEEFGHGTPYLVKKIMKEYKWRRTKQIIKPILTDDHKRARLNWSFKHLTMTKEEVFGDSSTCYIHADEKWFYLFHLHRHQWMPHGKSVTDCDTLLRASSKTQIPKVMFLGAVGYPRPEHGFDGNIGIWPVTYTKKAKRTSKYHKIGDEYEEMTNMDTKKFIAMVKDLLIPAAISKVGGWAKKIVLQIDSAGGHGVKISQAALTYDHGDVKIETVLQPTKSPDLNVLDLGAWYSLQVAVDKEKRNIKMRQILHVDEPVKPSHRIIELVENTWNDWVDEKRISKLFHDVYLVMKEIVRTSGNNNFEVPHTKREKRK